MNEKRVEEILQSHGVINVSYNGIPVWIEGIRGNEADVSYIGMNGRQTVALGELEETGPPQTI